MKQAIKLFLVAFAASMVISSCTKDVFDEQGSRLSEGTRVISVSFGNQTRTALGEDGLTPEFVGKEIIRVSNGKEYEDCEVKVDDNGKASFFTNLEGTLTAVYPSTAAKMENNTITGIQIAANQTGKFADANIAMAENITTKAMFMNQTALFVVTPPKGAVRLIVKSLKPIIDGVARTGNSLPINTEVEGNPLTVTATEQDDNGNYYVSLCEGVGLNDLSFEAEFEQIGTGSVLGIPEKTIAQAGLGTATRKNVAYKVGTNPASWHEYVTINGTKWATMNIGASTPADAGMYFAWGDTQGQSPAFSKGFYWTNCPFTNGGMYNSSNKSIFTKYVSTGKENYMSGTGIADNKTTLDLCDDAAYVNWGGAWRMPTREQYKALSKFFIPSSFESGWSFGTPSGTIFLPDAGYGNATDINNIGQYGHYWSSSLCTSNPSGAYSLYMGGAGGGVVTASHNRYCGQSVRAIIDDDLRHKIVIWENDDTHENIEWSGKYRFSSEEHTTGEEIYAIPMDEWNKVIKSGTFYLLGRKNTDTPIVKVTTGWWSPSWLGDNIAGSNVYTDNGDGTFLVEINFAGDPILDVLDAQHLLFTGQDYTPLELYYYDHPSKPAATEHVLWEGEVISDGWTDQPSLLGNWGEELLAVNAKAGQEVRFYLTPLESDWHMQIVEGHWGWVTAWSELSDDERNAKMIYCSYCSVGADTEDGTYTEWDLDAHGGYIPITLTQEMLDVVVSPNPDVDWGGSFIANGDNSMVTKVTIMQ